MKLSKITLNNIAGYSSAVWDYIQPNINLLVGRNGVGKSTILQSIAFALTYLSSKRSEDLLLKTYPEASIELNFKGLPESIKLGFEDIRGKQGYRDYSHKFVVWQVVENRQPKNTIGIGRNSLNDHPTSRYPNAISELKALLSGSLTDRSTAHEAIEICKRIPAATNDDEWDWIEKEISKRGQKYARPVSCGQFDIAAFSLDLVRIKKQLSTEKDTSAFVILDNPETFLHPACQQKVLDMILDLIPDAQLFIASHSLKLLCSNQSKSVFWLSRDNANEHSIIDISPTRGLPFGGKKVFFELYGDDVNSAVFNLIHSFESPEYYNYLYQCALPPKEELRKAPSKDRQMQAIVEELPSDPDDLVILDIGTGHGDLLTAILESEDRASTITFIGASFDPSETLTNRIAEGISKGKITPSSKYISSLTDVGIECDVVVLCNVCHEIPISEIGRTLGQIIRTHLKRNGVARLVIHEVETLTCGESDYLMWDPSDYKEIFSVFEFVDVETKHLEIHNSVPLDTTIISVKCDCEIMDEFENLIDRQVYKQLPIKKDRILNEVIKLTEPQPPKIGLEEAMRQRRLAFLMSEITSICIFEKNNHQVASERK